MRKWLLSLVASLAFALGLPSSFSGQVQAQLAPKSGPLQGLRAVAYKSPSCGCCEGYIAFLEKHGVSVQTVSDDAALAQAKVDYGVPSTAQSCHTIVLDGYVIEGHVPLAALEKLFTERPDIDGVALPGMPTGTPGMPGPRQGPFEVLELEDGAARAFMTL